MKTRRAFVRQITAFGAGLSASAALRANTVAEEKKPIPVILDTDIGTDVDDAFALALIVASPELDLRGVTTVGRDAARRARMTCRFLSAIGREDIPVAAGALPQPDEEIEKQGRYADHGERTSRPVQETAVEFLYRQLKEKPGELTLLAIGPLTNLARLFRERADCKPWIKRLVLMGGSVRVGYNGKAPPETEWNVKCDIAAAQTVFAADVPLVVAPLDATTMLKLEEPARRKLFDAKTPLTEQVRELYRLWGAATPTLFDPVAVALCFDEHFCTMKDMPLRVDDKGMTVSVKGKANARVATEIRAPEFLRWYVERVSAAKPGFGKK